METNIQGVIVTSLKQISHEKGNIYHGIKQSESSFKSFGESYFSFINYNEIKAWKRHHKMVCNIVVPVGEVELILFGEPAIIRELQFHHEYIMVLVGSHKMKIYCTI